MRPRRGEVTTAIRAASGSASGSVSGTGRRALLLWLVAGAALLLAACGGDDGDGEPDGRPRVLASTAIIAEFARQVAGDDAVVTTLIPVGVEVHAFEPTTDAARRIAEADLIFVNGYNLEAGVLDVIVENRASDAALVVVSEGISPLRAGGVNDAGDPGDLLFAAGDPHMWLDVENAERYVDRIRRALVEVDPAHAGGYERRAGAYVEELRTLRAELEETIGAIPASRRKLVVFHDAFRYFAQAFQFELVAAVSPANPNQEPSPRDVADTINTVEREGVPAVFREPQFSSQVLDLVAEETGVRVLTLYSVPIGGEASSYAEMMRANARALVDGLASP